MKIIAINALSALRGGGQTYLINLLTHLPQGNYKIILIVNAKNKKIFENYKSSKIKIYECKFGSKSIFHRIYWEQFLLQSFLEKESVDIYYAPGGIMVSKLPKKVTSVTALRNMLPFDERERKRFPLISYIRFKLWLLRYVFLKSYKLSDKVIFISEYSKNVVKKFIPDINNKSIIIPHGLNSQFLKENIKTFELPKFLEENKFYLYVSILDVYKAQKELVLVWKKLKENNFPYPLVLVGPKYNEYGEQVLDLIKYENLEKQIIYLGKIDYEKLPELYKSARALVFSSSCECCPNILLEKLSAKKPVFCSDIQPMPEFAEDSAIYFNPYNPESLSNEILKLEKDKKKMETLSKKAYSQALKFNWHKTVKKTINYLLNEKEKQNNV